MADDGLKKRIDMYCKAYVVRIYDTLDTVDDCVYWLEYYRLVRRHMLALRQSKHVLRPLQIAYRRGRQCYKKLMFLCPNHIALKGDLISGKFPLARQYRLLEKDLKKWLKTIYRTK